MTQAVAVKKYTCKRHISRSGENPTHRAMILVNTPAEVEPRMQRGTVPTSTVPTKAVEDEISVEQKIPRTAPNAQMSAPSPPYAFPVVSGKKWKLVTRHITTRSEEMAKPEKKIRHFNATRTPCFTSKALSKRMAETETTMGGT
mmetsp:Transcript_27897/g.50895  ORF Transcript_27897/g.50895 Transcript_27897/m.50895 type:complete len:144 (+) Transcript_27897:1127-1558(+)